MYVTRFLSHYKAFPEALKIPPEGPNSGYLVIQDEESEIYSCLGYLQDLRLAGLPFPQNKILTTRYSSGDDSSYEEIVFIPVLNQPLSSNRYYAIKPDGSHKGEAFICAREEDRETFCCCTYIRDAIPRPLDPNDGYQQFEIVRCYTTSDGYYYAKSLAEDGHPPNFLQRKGWEIYSRTPKNYTLLEAQGIDGSLRSRLPDFSFSLSTKSSNSVVVGKWYYTFVFIKEGRPSDQVTNSTFYEMTLEQKWECVFEQKNEHDSEGDIVHVNTTFPSEAVFIGENKIEAKWDERNMMDGAIWFKCLENDNGGHESVGINLEIIERMRWEEDKVGWVGGGKKMIKREEMFEGINDGWKKFGCYILIESFLLKRMDGSIDWTYDFGHTHQIMSIFE